MKLLLSCRIESMLNFACRLRLRCTRDSDASSRLLLPSRRLRGTGSLILGSRCLFRRGSGRGEGWRGGSGGFSSCRTVRSWSCRCS